MTQIKLNIESVFKICILNESTNTYRLQPNKVIRVYGVISENILRKIIDINIDVLKRLFVFKTLEHKIDRSAQINELIELACKHSKDEKLQLYGYNIGDILRDYTPQLTAFLDTHFEQNIDDIIEYAPDVYEHYQKLGAKIEKCYIEKKYNELVQLLMEANDITMEFTIHLLLTMINISYILFAKLSVPTSEEENEFISEHNKNKNIVYETNLDNITLRKAYGALQQFIINNDRDIMYQRQLMDALSEKYDFPEYIRKSSNSDEIEAYIFNKICKQSTDLKSYYPMLTIKREFQVDFGKIYNIWNNIQNNEKCKLAHSFGFKRGESFNMLPYILTRGKTTHIDRIKEFARYTIKTLVSTNLNKTDASHFNDIFKDYDKIFDYLLFPDRENIMKFNKMYKKVDDITNINAYENGPYNSSFLIKFVIDKSDYIRQIIIRLLKFKQS